MTKRGASAAEPGLDPARLFASLQASRGVVLAVSGGIDSTALMALLAAWRDRPPALVATVDHGLRPESAGEANLVAANAERLGLACRIMRTPSKPEGGNLQDWARRARYCRLAEAARQSNCDTIVTAHHLEDQAETFLLRLARGSGVYGLAGISEDGEREELRLVRPLLGVTRAELAAFVAASGLPTVDDPSNRDLRYHRVRMRRWLPELAEDGLTARRLAETAGRLGRAAAALDHYAGALISENFTVDRFGVVRGRAAALGQAPEEIGLRALARVLRAVAGAEHTPRLDPILGLREALLGAGVAPLKRTLHGVVVSLVSGALTAEREWGRGGIASLPARGGEALVWDGRFRIAVPRLEGELSVGPLGGASRRFASRPGLATLPGLFQDGELLAVPPGVDPLDGGAALAAMQVECLVGTRLGPAASPAAMQPE